MASGDWGGGGAKVPRMVKRNGFAKNVITEPEAKPAQGKTPILKYYPSPQYERGPFNPEFKRKRAT